MATNYAKIPINAANLKALINNGVIVGTYATNTTMKKARVGVSYRDPNSTAATNGGNCPVTVSVRSNLAYEEFTSSSGGLYLPSDSDVITDFIMGARLGSLDVDGGGYDGMILYTPNSGGDSDLYWQCYAQEIGYIADSSGNFNWHYMSIKDTSFVWASIAQASTTLSSTYNNTKYVLSSTYNIPSGVLTTRRGHEANTIYYINVTPKCYGHIIQTTIRNVTDLSFDFYIHSPRTTDLTANIGYRIFAIVK